jgi:hypothetical protein
MAARIDDPPLMHAEQKPYQRLNCRIAVTREAEG